MGSVRKFTAKVTMDLERLISLIITLYWFIVGTTVGSFLGVIIDRLPNEKSIIWGRSHCDFCKKNLRWFELIPILSFVFSNGKCLRCHKALSLRYPFYEIVTGMIFVVLWMISGGIVSTFAGMCLIACSLLAITIIDLDHMLIPDLLVVSTIIGTIVLFLQSNQSLMGFLKNNLLTAVVSYMLFYALWAGTKRRGIGFGDVKLAFALGLLVGYPQVIISLYGAFLTGAGVAIILMLYGKKTMKSAVPFGPFLVLGALISYFINAHSVLSFIL